VTPEQPAPAQSRAELVAELTRLYGRITQIEAHLNVMAPADGDLEWKPAVPVQHHGPDGLVALKARLAGPGVYAFIIGTPDGGFTWRINAMRKTPEVLAAGSADDVARAQAQVAGWLTMSAEAAARQLEGAAVTAAAGPGTERTAP
jgi:hypothetical protein